MEIRNLTLEIYIISRLTHIYYTEKLRELGITMGQFPFLMELKEQTGISQEKLSARLRISKSTTALIIRQLLARKLVQRTVDPADRRNFRLALTEEGAALIPEIEAVIDRCHTLLTGGFSDREKKTLIELLSRTRKQAEERICTASSKGRQV